MSKIFINSYSQNFRMETQTPEQRMKKSMYLAISQIHLATEMKMKRQQKYGKADPNDKTFDYDKSEFFPKECFI